MLYVNIDVDYKKDEDALNGYSYDEIVDIVIKETMKYITQEIPVVGIVLKRELYDWLLYQSKKQIKFWNNVKCDKIESFYGYKVAIKE